MTARYHPPNSLDGDHLTPYTTDFWAKDWSERCRSDPVLQKLVPPE
jgi:hypothetical protein